MVSAVPARLVDPTFYPVEEKVGEDSLQRMIGEAFRALVEHYLVTLGTPTFVGADQFIYWVQHRPNKCVGPDVYVLPGVPRDARISCLKTWEAGVIPSLALEIVSPNGVDKDYRDGPPKYDELGVRELVVFDPDYTQDSDRLRFQVFRRVRGRGLVRVTATNEDRVASRVLKCWIRAVGEGNHVRLRLATDERGDTLFPTQAEAAEARAENERGRAENERERAENERGRAEREHERAENAEAQLIELRAELDRLKKKKT